MTYAYSNNGTGFRRVDEDTQDIRPDEVLFEDEATPEQLRAAFPGYDAGMLEAGNVSKIMALEKTITQRRIREAMTTPDKVVQTLEDGTAITAKSWLDKVEADIEALRP